MNGKTTTPSARLVVILAVLTIGLLALIVLITSNRIELKNSLLPHEEAGLKPAIDDADRQLPSGAPSALADPDDLSNVPKGGGSVAGEIVTVPVIWVHAPMNEPVIVRLTPLDAPSGQAEIQGTLYKQSFSFHLGSGTRYAIVPPSADVIILAHEIVLTRDGNSTRVVTMEGRPTDHLLVASASRVTLVADCPAGWLYQRELSLQLITRDTTRVPTIGATLSHSLKAGASETLLVPRYGVHFQVESDEYFLKGTTPENTDTVEDGQTITLHFGALVPLLVEVYEEVPGDWLELLREEARVAYGSLASHAVLGISVVAKDRSGHGGTVGHQSVTRPLAEIAESGGVVDRFEVPVAVSDGDQKEYSILVTGTFSDKGVLAAGAGRIASFDSRPVVRVEVTKTHPEIRVLVVDELGMPIAGINVAVGVEYVQDDAGYRRLSSGKALKSATNDKGVAVFLGIRGSPESVLAVTIQARLKVLDSPGRITIKDALLVQTLKFVLDRPGGTIVIDLVSFSDSRASQPGGTNELLLFPRNSAMTEPLTRKLPTPVEFPVVYTDVPEGFYDPVLLLDGIPCTAPSINVSIKGETKLVITPRAEGMTTLRFIHEGTQPAIDGHVLPVPMPAPLAWGVLQEARRVVGSRFPMFKLDSAGEIRVPWSVALEDVDRWIVDLADGTKFARPHGATSLNATTVQASLRTLASGSIHVQLDQLDKSDGVRYEVGVSAVSREDERVWTVNMHWGAVFPAVEDSVEIASLPEGEYILFIIQRKRESMSFLPDEKYRNRVVVRQGDTVSVRFPQ